MARYALGLDFGTESARAILVNVETGEEAAEEVFPFPDGVITDELPVPGGAKLDHDWALQNPADYLAALEATIVTRLRSVNPTPVRGSTMCE